MTSSMTITIPANLSATLAGQSVKLIGDNKPSTLLARLQTIFTRPARIDFSNLSFALAQKAAFSDSLTYFHEHTIITSLQALSEVVQEAGQHSSMFELICPGRDAEAVKAYRDATQATVTINAAKKALQSDTLAYGRLLQKANKPGAAEDLKHDAARVKEDLDSRRQVLHSQQAEHKEALSDAELGKCFAYINEEEFAQALALLDKVSELQAKQNEIVASLTHSVGCYAARIASLSANAIIV